MKKVTKNNKKIGERILGSVLNRNESESFCGDIEEMYLEMRNKKGKIYACLWYWIQILKSMWNSMDISFYWGFELFKNFIKTAFRYLLKHKKYTVINILGLAIGLTCFFLIMLWVQFEKSYDKFNENIKNLYCLQASFYSDGKLNSIRYRAPVVMCPALKNELPEIKAFARLEPNNGWAFSYKNKEFKVENAYQADHSFLTMFSFPIIKGDTENALKEPNTAVISNSLAQRIFGSEDPIDKMIKNEWWNTWYRITAVIEDVPKNSHIKFDLLGSIHAHINQQYLQNNWNDFSVISYILVNNDANTPTLQAKINKIYKKHRENISKDIFLLKPVGDIHLYSESELEERVLHSDIRYINLLSIVALLIILTVWINHVNMTFIQAFERAKEVGIKKIIGVNRIQLIFQFLFESIILHIIAVVGALTIIKFMLNQFNGLFGLSLSLDQFKNISDWIPFLSFYFLGSLITCLCIAVILTSFKPLNMIKRIIRSNQSGLKIRRYFVITQFIAMTAVLTSLIIVYTQLNFMRNYDKGMTLDKIILIKKPGSVPEGNLVEIGKSFVNEILNHSAIENVSLSEFPGKNYYARIALKRENQDSEIMLRRAFVDENFIPTYEIKLKAGRNFSDKYIGDEEAIIINETASNLFGFENPEQAVDKYLKYEDEKVKILGVIKDYNQLYLKNKIDPICLCTDFTSIDNTPNEYFSVRINLNNFQNIIPYIRKKFSVFFPHTQFDYLILEEYFNKQYRFEHQMINMFLLFELLSSFISGLGLWGVFSYTALRRTKEMGIRKVFGASVSNVLFELIRDLIKWIVIANILSFPVVYYISNKWLQNYAYRIDTYWWMFALAGALAFVIALGTISWQVVRSATTNPVKSLRYE